MRVYRRIVKRYTLLLKLEKGSQRNILWLNVRVWCPAEIFSFTETLQKKGTFMIFKGQTKTILSEKRSQNEYTIFFIKWGYTTSWILNIVYWHFSHFMLLGLYEVTIWYIPIVYDVLYLDFKSIAKSKRRYKYFGNADIRRLSFAHRSLYHNVPFKQHICLLQCLKDKKGTKNWLSMKLKKIT